MFCQIKIHYQLILYRTRKNLNNKFIHKILYLWCYVKIFGISYKYFLSLKNIYKIYQKYSNTENTKLISVFTLTQGLHIDTRTSHWHKDFTLTQGLHIDTQKIFCMYWYVKIFGISYKYFLNLENIYKI